ncbi:hypothetical protein, partial [Ramlibacter sp. WS9]|uniref:hypothetical protein n=1 Tax=Ramlibacter sp. WS9 TaxID=1882741 RepID=UPI0011754D33
MVRTPWELAGAEKVAEEGWAPAGAARGWLTAVVARLRAGLEVGWDRDFLVMAFPSSALGIPRSDARGG